MKELNIIGGSGFIGTNLSKLFTELNLSFVNIDKNNSKRYPENRLQGDVRDIESLRETLVADSKIINLAAEHADNVTPLSLYHDVNVQGAKNICKVASEKNIDTIIFTSTVAVYGFAPLNTNETGDINPFNEYGKTKHEAEEVFTNWQQEDPSKRALVIIRPTVVFGENNRGNVFNLLQQIASSVFLMIGNGRNKKSMAYVENISSFIKYSLDFEPGVHVYNYIDKPDYNMNTLILKVKKVLGLKEGIGPRLPFSIGILIGKTFDLISKLTGRKFKVSEIRIRKFCANTLFDTSISETGFVPPISIDKGLERTLKYEFIKDNK